MALPVVANIYDLESIDALIITDMREPQAAFDKSINTIPTERVLVLPLLGINSDPRQNEDVEIAS